MELERLYTKVNKVLQYHVQSGGEQIFVIFPYGERGMLVHDILAKRYGLAPVLVDNGMAGTNGIISLKEFAEQNTGVAKVLLACENPKVYPEVVHSLLEKVNLEQVIDVFSPSMYFDDVYYDPPYYERPRWRALEMLAREIYRNDVSGAIAECGVYRGEFANIISMCIPDRKFYLFDTFCGFDSRDIDIEEEKMSGKFRAASNAFYEACTSEEIALSNIAYHQSVVVRKGHFPDTAVGLEDERFSFVSLDTDLYKPIKSGLQFFWPRLNPGGYIFVDNFGHPELLGVRKAVVEFSKENNVGYTSVYKAEGNDTVAVLAKPLR